MQNQLRKWLNRLVEPGSEIRGAERHKARLISGITLAIAVTAFFATPFLFFGVGSLTGVATNFLREPAWWVVVGTGGLMASIYALSRTRHYRFSAIMMIAATLGGMMAISITSYPRAQAVNSILVYSVFAILLTDIFFSLRHVATIIAVLIVGEFLLGGVVGSPYSLLDAVLIAPVQIIVGGSMLVAKMHRDSLQALAEKKIKESARLERHRVAEEIHDAALQDILLAGRYMGIIKKRISDTNTDEKVAEYLEACETTIDRANVRLRGLLKEARLANTVKEPLGNMIRDWLHLVKLWSDTTISLKLDLDDAVEQKLGSVSTKLALYTIVQEATMNAIRHARAEKIEVVVTTEKNGVLLQVQDDGVGFDGTGGLGGGIYNMNSRAEEIGGRLTIRKGETSGTVVTFRSNPLT